MGQRHRSAGDLHAPHIIDLEVASTVRGLASTGLISPDRADQAIVDLIDLPLYRHTHTNRSR